MQSSPPDFSAEAYSLMCRALSEAGYNGISLRDWIRDKCQRPRGEKYAILRHDVDRFPKNCLALARIESDLGFQASYYFRVPKTYHPAVIRAVADMGHEVGLHYESLDKARGDPQLARNSFRRDLELLREIAYVETAVAHGNPLSKWTNRDLWRHTGYEELGILAEGYLSIDFGQLWYFTDTGRTWADDGPNLKDTVPVGQSEAPNKPHFETTAELVELLDHSIENLYILTHPERWPDNWAGRLRSRLLDAAANIVKRGVGALRPAADLRRAGTAPKSAI